MVFLNLEPFAEDIRSHNGIYRFFYTPIYLAFFMFSVVLMTIVQFFVPNKNTFSKIIKLYVKYVYYLVMPYEHIGYRGRPKEPVIVVGNHSSLVDFLILNTMPFDCFEMVSSGIFKRLWFMARILRGSKYIVVEYGKREETIKTAVDFMRDGNSLFIFPEGDINSTENPTLPFRTGAFEIARRSGYMIQPVVIRNSREFAPYTPGKKTWFNPMTLPLKIHWLEPYRIPEDADINEEATKLQKIYGHYMS
jgi:1-acyl-sn-glycerol-3-phosphate acyltransferase